MEKVRIEAEEMNLPVVKDELVMVRGIYVGATKAYSYISVNALTSNGEKIDISFRRTKAIDLAEITKDIVPGAVILVDYEDCLGIDDHDEDDATTYEHDGELYFHNKTHHRYQNVYKVSNMEVFKLELMLNK